MTIPVDLIIIGLVLAAVLLVFVVGVEATIPLFKRVEFANICDKYFRLLNIKRGLSSTDENNLKMNFMILDLSM